jgi:hypothetical protein
VASDYRFSQALIARFMGAFLASLGVMVFLLAVLVGVFGLPVELLTAGVVLVVVSVLVMGFLLTRRSYVVRLGESGYQVRFIRGAGVKQARWKDVEDVVATSVAGESCVVLRLRDGRTTTVPVGVLAGDTDVFVKDLQAHLNRGHGYRRIN